MSQYPKLMLELMSPSRQGEEADLAHSLYDLIVRIISESTGLPDKAFDPIKGVWHPLLTRLSQNQGNPLDDFTPPSEMNKGLKAYLDNIDRLTPSLDSQSRISASLSESDKSIFDALCMLHRMLNNTQLSERLRGAVNQNPLNKAAINGQLRLILQMISGRLSSLPPEVQLHYLHTFNHPNLAFAAQHLKTCPHIADMSTFRAAASKLTIVTDLLEASPQSIELYGMLEKDKIEEIALLIMQPLIKAMREHPAALLPALLDKLPESALFEDDPSDITDENKNTYLEQALQTARDNIAEIAERFKQQKIIWQRSFEETVRHNKVDWSYAIDTCFMLLVMGQSSSRTLTPDQMLDADIYQPPKFNQDELYFASTSKKLRELVDQLMIRLEVHNITGNGLRNTSSYLPGTRSVDTTPEFAPLARGFDSVVASAFETILSLFPQSTSTSHTPKPQQKGLMRQFIRNIVPALDGAKGNARILAEAEDVLSEIYAAEQKEEANCRTANQGLRRRFRDQLNSLKVEVLKHYAPADFFALLMTLKFMEPTLLRAKTQEAAQSGNLKGTITSRIPEILSVTAGTAFNNHEKGYCDPHDKYFRGIPVRGCLGKLSSQELRTNPATVPALRHTQAVQLYEAQLAFRQELEAQISKLEAQISKMQPMANGALSLSPDISCLVNEVWKPGNWTQTLLDIVEKRRLSFVNLMLKQSMPGYSVTRESSPVKPSPLESADIRGALSPEPKVTSFPKGLAPRKLKLRF